MLVSSMMKRYLRGMLGLGALLLVTPGEAEPTAPMVSVQSARIVTGMRETVDRLKKLKASAVEIEDATQASCIDRRAAGLEPLLEAAQQQRRVATNAAAEHNTILSAKAIETLQRLAVQVAEMSAEARKTCGFTEATTVAVRSIVEVHSTVDSDPIAGADPPSGIHVGGTAIERPPQASPFLAPAPAHALSVNALSPGVGRPSPVDTRGQRGPSGASANTMTTSADVAGYVDPYRCRITCPDALPATRPRQSPLGGQCVGACGEGCASCVAAPRERLCLEGIDSTGKVCHASCQYDTMTCSTSASCARVDTCEESCAIFDVGAPRESCRQDCTSRDPSAAAAENMTFSLRAGGPTDVAPGQCR